MLNAALSKVNVSKAIYATQALVAKALTWPTLARVGMFVASAGGKAFEGRRLTKPRRPLARFWVKERRYIVAKGNGAALALVVKAPTLPCAPASRL